jgi:hypothetical protein
VMRTSSKMGHGKEWNSFSSHPKWPIRTKPLNHRVFGSLKARAREIRRAMDAESRSSTED